MSIYKRRIAIENRGKIVALDQEGYSQRQIADRVECCQKSVSLILKKEKTNGSLGQFHQGLEKRPDEKTVY